ncbi:MAG: putative Zn finger-like uncharacterized protein [Myxococcota bacterium]|jgi:predicted Zn finger-like uncharacterized protein
MIVTCDHCSARYRLDESKIPGRGARVTCPSCRHVFVVYRRDAAETPPAVVTPPRPVAPARPSVEEEAADLDVNTLDFRSVGIGSWKVKVKIGLIYDFNDYKTFNKNVRDGRVTASDLISFDGSEWSPIGDLSALSQRFCEVYVRAERSGEEEAEEEVGEDEPTRIMSASDMNIPAKKSLVAPVAEEPVGPSVAVGVGEPASGSGLDSTSALADAFADAAAEVDGEGWKSGRSDSNQPPRFVDPFEKKKQQAASQPRRSTNRTSSNSTESEGGARGLLFAAALLGAVLLGGGYWFMTQNSNAEVTPPPDAPLVEAPADDGTDPDQIRDDLIKRIEENAEPVEDVEPEPGFDIMGFPVEEELIVIIPDQFKTENDGDDLEQNGSMSVGGGEGASSHAASGDAAAQSANWSAAAAAYQKAADIEPRNSRYLEKLCEYQYRSGNVSSARSSCSQAKQSGSRAASKWLGHISYDQGDMSGAVGHYQSYLSSNPADRNEIQRRIDSISGG